MNLVLIILILIMAIILWFLLSFMFKPLGKLVYGIWKEAIDIINENDEEKGESNKNER